MDRVVGEAYTEVVGEDTTEVVGEEITEVVWEKITKVVGEETTEVVWEEVTEVVGEEATEVVGGRSRTIKSLDLVRGVEVMDGLVTGVHPCTTRGEGMLGPDLGVVGCCVDGGL